MPISDGAQPEPTFLEARIGRRRSQLLGAAIDGKTDLIPNRANEMWIDPQERRDFHRQLRRILRNAARKHADARHRSATHDEFDKWVAAQRLPAVDDPDRGGASKRFSIALMRQLPHGKRHRRAAGDLVRISRI